MSVRRAYTVPLLAGPLLAALLVMPANAARQNGEKSAQARPQAQGRKAGRGPGTGNAQSAQPKPDNHPGEQLLSKLSKMTPEEREQALSRLPPARRAQLEQRIQNFQ